MSCTVPESCIPNKTQLKNNRYLNNQHQRYHRYLILAIGIFDATVLATDSYRR